MALSYAFSCDGHSFKDVITLLFKLIDSIQVARPLWLIACKSKVRKAFCDIAWNLEKVWHIRNFKGWSMVEDIKTANESWFAWADSDTELQIGNPF